MEFAQKLNDLKQKGRYRSLCLPRGIDLTSNDYLGLAGSAYLRAAAIDYLQGGGAMGAGGSRLLRGNAAEHISLEEAAAEFFAAPKALYFSSGFQANATLFQTLPSRHDTIIFDEFVHASAREGIQNSHAQHIKAAHNDVAAFEAALQNAKGRAWIAVESVYSMDGDCAPLEDLYALAVKYDAVLVVDEAHGTGVCGTGGRGLAYDLYGGAPTPTLPQKGEGVFPENLIVLHTCGKALGLAGGLVCASEEVVEYMVNAARGFIYSTAPMPLQAHLVQKALEFIGSAEGVARRDALAGLCRKAQQYFGGAGTHIVPIVIGDDGEAVHIAKMLQQKGWDIRAIRPPTVPEGKARLRLSLSADLTVQNLDDFAADLDGLIINKAA